MEDKKENVMEDKSEFVVLRGVFDKEINSINPNKLRILRNKNVTNEDLIDYIFVQTVNGRDEYIHQSLKV